ncbi:hypothetical protein ACFQ2B_00400 [Streptomyces stramineus]
MTPLVSTMAILGIVIALSAWPLLRGRLLPAAGCRFCSAGRCAA